MSFKSQDRLRTDYTNIFRKATLLSADHSGEKTANPFSLRLTAEERAHLNEEAGNQPLGAYIRSRLLGERAEKRRLVRKPSPDHKILALILSELGRSRLASNMNQLARAANIGVLDISDQVACDIHEACRAITAMRKMLITALGVKPEAEE